MPSDATVHEFMLNSPQKFIFSQMPMMECVGNASFSNWTFSLQISNLIQMKNAIFL
jgi:hypothetical protein